MATRPTDTEGKGAEMPENTDDMVTVRMRVDVEVKVPRQSWAGEWDVEPQRVNADVHDYVMHNVVEGWTSKAVTDCGGTFTASVVERPATLLMVDGSNLDAMVNELLSRNSVHTFRVDPRPNGFAFKVNEGAWSPTIGSRVPRD